MNKFAERLKEVRTIKKVSQLKLANFMHTTQQTISRWENGNVLPDYNVLVKLCEYFEVTADYMLGITEY